jgi:hypothetical protein
MHRSRLQNLVGVMGHNFRVVLEREGDLPAVALGYIQEENALTVYSAIALLLRTDVQAGPSLRGAVLDRARYTSRYLFPREREELPALLGNEEAEYILRK